MKVTPAARREAALRERWVQRAEGMRHLRGNDPVRFAIELCIHELDAANLTCSCYPWDGVHTTDCVKGTK